MHKCPKCAKSQVVGTLLVNGSPEPCFACGGHSVPTTDREGKPCIARQRGTGMVSREVYERELQKRRDWSLAARAIEAWEKGEGADGPAEASDLPS